MSTHSNHSNKSNLKDSDSKASRESKKYLLNKQERMIYDRRKSNGVASAGKTSSNVVYIKHTAEENQMAKQF